jgi:hypothetical protein
LGAGYRGSNWSKFAFGGVIPLGRAFSGIRPSEVGGYDRVRESDDVSVGGEAGSAGVEDGWDLGGCGVFEGLGVSISGSVNGGDGGDGNGGGGDDGDGNGGDDGNGGNGGPRT